MHSARYCHGSFAKSCLRRLARRSSAFVQSVRIRLPIILASECVTISILLGSATCFRVTETLFIPDPSRSFTREASRSAAFSLIWNSRLLYSRATCDSPPSTDRNDTAHGSCPMTCAFRWRFLRSSGVFPIRILRSALANPGKALGSPP